jgi:hypothetical protein
VQRITALYLTTRRPADGRDARRQHVAGSAMSSRTLGLARGNHLGGNGCDGRRASDVRVSKYVTGASAGCSVRVEIA